MSVLEFQRVAGPEVAAEPTHLGVVRFLNARPIVAGLDGLSNWAVTPAPPSELIGLLSDQAVDVALCSAIDLMTAPFDVAWLPVAPLGCDGETLTVRVFARKPLNEVTRIHCDTDSHTSIALLRVLLAEVWKHDPELVPLDSSEEIEDISIWNVSTKLIKDRFPRSSSPRSSCVIISWRLEPSRFKLSTNDFQHACRIPH